MKNTETKLTAQEVMDARENGEQNLYHAPMQNLLFWSIPDYIEELEGAEVVEEATVEVFEEDENGVIGLEEFLKEEDVSLVTDFETDERFEEKIINYKNR